MLRIAAHAPARTAPVRAGQRAVARDVGAQHMAQRRVGVGVQQRPTACAVLLRASRGCATRGMPAPSTRTSKARHEALAGRASPASAAARPARVDGGAADDHARRRRRRAAPRTSARVRTPPPTWHCEIARCEQPADQGAVAWRAVARAVEIDHVQPARAAARDSARSSSQRIVRVHASPPRSRPRAGARSGRRADRWRESASISRSARGNCAASCAPTRPERSGWNCTPWKLPRCTTAVKAAAVVGAGHACARRPAPRSCARSRRSRPRRMPSSSGIARSGSELVPAHVRHRQAGARRAGARPRRARRPRSGGVALLRAIRTAAACPGRCRAAAASAPAARSRGRCARRRAMASCAAPTPGRITWLAPPMLARIVDQARAHAEPLQRELAAKRCWRRRCR